MMRIIRCYSKPLFTVALFLFSSPIVVAGSLHPLCLDPLVELGRSDTTVTSLDLRACQKRYSHLPFDQKMPWQVSFSSSALSDEVTDEQASEEPEDLPAFAGYNVIGQLENQQVLINYAVNYGGSGTFTFGFLLKGIDLDGFTHLDKVLASQKRSANLQLTLRIHGGDRCIGGITDMSIEAPDKISVSRNLTPYELVTLGVPKDQLTDRYGDLPDCSICCVGQYTEIIHLDGSSELQGVQLNGNRLERDNPQSKQQQCLTKLVNAQSHKVVFNRVELQALQKNYQEQCAEPQ